MAPDLSRTGENSNYRVALNQGMSPHLHLSAVISKVNSLPHPKQGLHEDSAAQFLETGNRKADVYLRRAESFHSCLWWIHQDFGVDKVSCLLCLQTFYGLWIPRRVGAGRTSQWQIGRVEGK